ncbi:MAG TPA: sulfate adenylyltransferase [Polyangiaceae bacterium]
MVDITNTASAAQPTKNGSHASSATLTRGPAREVPAHGGKLVDRLVQADEAADLLLRARGLPRVRLDARTGADAELIATGALSPLDGFLRRDDYFGVIRDVHLSTGELFPIPITLGVPRAEASRFHEGGDAALVDSSGELVGTLSVDEIYELDRDLEAKEVYKTTETKHPGVAWLFEHRDEVALGGRLTLARRTIERKFPQHHRDPAELRSLIATRGWRRTVAFQTRNPIHRAHEYLLRCALEITDGLVVHPLVGETKGDDVPAAVRVRCYEVLLSKYFPADRAVLSVFPFAMRYAGPREALLHAIARQNYGFSHFIVGRDHAGVGNYYGTYDAQRIFETLAPRELAIQTLFFEHSFYCRACAGVASIKTCPHAEDQRLILSGTRVRELLSSGEAPPPEFSRPEVAAILIAAYREAASKEG